MNKFTYNTTRYACYMGYISQAITSSLPPLLFAIFYDQLQMTLSLIALCIFIGYVVQLVVDCLAIRFVDKIGYRRSSAIGMAFIVTGLFLLGLLPLVVTPGYIGFMIAVIIYSIGSGLIEILITPIIEYLPTKKKISHMSLLHSMYCWGAAGNIIISTVLLVVFGNDSWHYIPWVLSLIPLTALYLFTKSPVNPPPSEHERVKTKSLFTSPIYILVLMIMLCAGAAEQVIYQWTPFFSEVVLGFPKQVGNLVGTGLFAALMGVGRTLHSLFGEKIPLSKVLMFCSLLCVMCYTIIALSPIPLLSITACGLCGLAVSMMWPGTISLTARTIPKGGTAMFGIMAIAGDIGCSLGTWTTGVVSDMFGMRYGFMVCLIFPILILIGVFLLRSQTRNNSNDKIDTYSENIIK